MIAIIIFFFGLALYFTGLGFVFISDQIKIWATIMVIVGFAMIVISPIIDIHNQSNAENDPIKYEIVTTKKIVTPTDSTLISIDTTYQKL